MMQSNNLVAHWADPEVLKEVNLQALSLESLAQEVSMQGLWPGNIFSTSSSGDYDVQKGICNQCGRKQKGSNMEKDYKLKLYPDY